VVNPLGVTEPMVGRKRAPLSAVTSRYLVLISIFPVLCIDLGIMYECLDLYICVIINDFYVE
jgi:hypothetical protein